MHATVVMHTMDWHLVCCSWCIYGIVCTRDDSSICFVIKNYIGEAHLKESIRVVRENHVEYLFGTIYTELNMP